jgi:hypothetical protein
VSTRTILLIALSAILVVAVFFIDPIPQDPSYHAFADSRLLLKIPNFWNVMSNIPFLIVGGAGLYYVRSKNNPGLLPDLSMAYLVFFAGIFLTGIGSAYYHYAPGNSTLVWDRLPMTLGFMAFITIIIGEHIVDVASVVDCGRSVCRLLGHHGGKWLGGSSTVCDSAVSADVADSPDPSDVPIGI